MLKLKNDADLATDACIQTSERSFSDQRNGDSDLLVGAVVPKILPLPPR